MEDVVAEFDSGDVKEEMQPTGEWEDVSPEKDRSVMKQVIRSGYEIEHESPKLGDKVFVHYVGTLTETGAEFDSSRKRGKAFEFRVGQGVIQGWSEAVPTMRRGETSKFRIAAEKAYGAQGQPPTIPANASLDFEIELLSFTDREDIKGDGSLTKKVMTEGNRWQKPNKDCDVLMEVRSTLHDGTGTSAWLETWWPSQQRDTALDVALEKEADAENAPAPPTTLPALLREGIETMKADEEANFRIFEGGSFDVRVKKWVENEECGGSKDPGAVVKRIEEKAPPSEDDWKRPNDLDVVIVSGLIYAASDPEKKTLIDFTKGAKWCVDEHGGRALLLDGYYDDDAAADMAEKAGAAEEFEKKYMPMCPGIEAAVRRMKVGETALVKIRKDWGYKADKHPDAPSDAVDVDLEARLKVEKLDEQAQSWNLKDGEKTAQVDAKRELGNKAFAEGDYQRAGRRYTAAVNIGQTDYDVDDPDEKLRLKKATYAARLNRAMCYLKCGDYASAKLDTTAVLEAEPDNPKALFRHAKALAGLDDWEGGKKHLRKLLDNDPTNVGAKRALADIIKQDKAFRDKQKKLYAGRKLFKTADKRIKEHNHPIIPEGPVEPPPFEQHAE